VARGARGLDGDLATDAAARLVTELTAAGAVPASGALMASCRILAGIPSLGVEIDDKTLPQEVRGDELGAISYTKGCYLGQETVARVHFRGHPNRRLALLVLDGEPDAAPAEASLDGKAVGRLTSAVWSNELDAWVGQAVIRREVEDGATLRAGGTTAVCTQSCGPDVPCATGFECLRTTDGTMAFCVRPMAPAPPPPPADSGCAVAPGRGGRSLSGHAGLLGLFGLLALVVRRARRRCAR